MKKILNTIYYFFKWWFGFGGLLSIVAMLFKGVDIEAVYYGFGLGLMIAFLMTIGNAEE